MGKCWAWDEKVVESGVRGVECGELGGEWELVWGVRLGLGRGVMWEMSGERLRERGDRGFGGWEC